MREVGPCSSCRSLQPLEKGQMGVGSYPPPPPREPPVIPRGHVTRKGRREERQRYQAASIGHSPLLSLHADATSHIKPSRAAPYRHWIPQ